MDRNNRHLHEILRMMLPSRPLLVFALSAHLAVLFVSGCAYEPKKGNLGARGREMPPAQGVFTGPTGEFAIIGRTRASQDPKVPATNGDAEVFTTKTNKKSQTD